MAHARLLVRRAVRRGGLSVAQAMSGYDPGMDDDVTLGDIRRELRRLTAMAQVGELPKPTRINGPDHGWPGHEWDLREMPRPFGTRDLVWVVRTLDEQDTEDGMVFVSSPESMAPGEDFVPMYTADARRLAMVLLAAADRAEHRAAGVPRLSDRRGQSGQ